MAKTKAHQKYISPVTGKPVPGSTTIIGGNLGWNKYILMAWAKRTAMAGEDPDKVRDQAGEIGTIAHEMVEEHLGLTYDAIPEKPFDADQYAPVHVEKGQLAYEGYLDWEKTIELEPLHSEIQLAHPYLLYGGTIDMMAMVNGVLTVVDFKTSKGVYADHIIQVASYRQMFIDYQESVEDPVDPDIPTLILHMSKEDGRFTPYHFTADQLAVPWRIFTHLVDLHYLKKRMPTT